MTSDVFSTFSETLIPHLKEVIRTGKAYVNYDNIQLLDLEIKTGCCALVKTGCNDRFKISIPYAGEALIWEIIFNHFSPTQPPDFIFDDKSFMPNIGDIPSLVSWDPFNSLSLISVIQELIELYKDFQISLIDKNSRLHLEYSSLLEESNIHEEDVEILLGEKLKNSHVNLMIHLQVNFSSIPPYLTKDNPGEDSAMLFIVFQSPKGGRVMTKLFLSPRVEHALGGSNALRIPNFLTSDHLVEYVPHLSKLLQTKIDIIVETHAKKKEYLAAFLAHFGRSVLEYDMEEMSKLSFLFEWKEFFFIITITLSPQFPKAQPTFSFQSVYHESNGKPYQVTKQNYPYSPRWTGNQMAERARSFILQNISEFQQSSLKNGKF